MKTLFRVFAVQKPSLWFGIAVLVLTVFTSGCDESPVGNSDEDPPSLSVDVEGEGSVSIDTLVASNEDSLHLLVVGVPDDGWYLDVWNGDSAFAGNPATVVVDTQASITAVFRQAVEPIYFDGIPFVEIPAGTFEMGSDGGPGRGDEVPKHSVTISEPFYMSMYEITLDTWLANGGQNLHPDRNDLMRAPVVMVSWVEVNEWIDRLNNEAGAEVYRLPTEAEWEYACRAGSTGDRYFDESEDLSDHAWHFGNWPRFAGIPEWDRERQPLPVGLKRPNSFGLFDMLGNVWEWVQDAYASDYYSESPSVDPQGPDPGSTSRVIRGGGDDEPELGYLRCNDRAEEGWQEAHFYSGFRLVREIE